MAISRFFHVAFALLLPLTAEAADIQGKIVGISDGDTVTVLTAEHRQVKVRLAEIDTPEKAQPYGSRAKQALSAMVFGQQVKVQVFDTDRYGRTVGKLWLDKVDVNRRMVTEGHAWVYRQYLSDKSLLDDEARARAARLGLWALPEAQRIPPWEWRHAGRQQPSEGRKVSTVPLSIAETQSVVCGAKQYCREMSVCTEARFYLNQCGLTRLDGDGDGIPCETLCR